MLVEALLASGPVNESTTPIFSGGPDALGAAVGLHATMAQTIAPSNPAARQRSLAPVIALTSTPVVCQFTPYSMAGLWTSSLSTNGSDRSRSRRFVIRCTWAEGSATWVSASRTGFMALLPELVLRGYTRPFIYAICLLSSPTPSRTHPRTWCPRARRAWG